MPDWNEVFKRFAGRISLENLLIAAVTLLICLLASRLLLRLARRLLARTRLEERIRRYILALLKALLYVLTAVFTGVSLGVNMNSLVALLSVGSLGVTLAAEDILGNVAGGLVILSSHPFSIGDFIESGGVSGTVEEISLNHTRLTTPDGLVALLPNKELASSRVTNYTLLGRRRIAWKMSAAYAVPTETVKAACYAAIRKTEHILADPAPAVYLTAFESSAVEFTVYCWTKTEDFWTTQFALAENLRSAFAENGVTIPFRQLDVRIQPPGPDR